MTEPKRLPFTTINNSERDNKLEKDPPTVRFTLSLDGSNDQQCAEFSYTDLLKKSLGEKKTVENGDDPFGEDEDHEALAAIAKKFEEKYNPKNTKWKKKHGRIQDYVDLGEGYDETDDFIDNTEAYDEVVPACLTTKLGGFYINCGKLDFKEISDDSDDDFKLGTLKKKKKKRKIESDSESDNEKKEKKMKKRKLKDVIEGNEKKKKKMLNGDDKDFKKPKKQNPEKIKKKMSPTVADLLKQQSESTAGGRTTPDVLSQSSHDGHESSQDEGIDSVIDSVIAMSKDNKLEAVFDSVIGMTDSNSKDDGEKPESIPKLPENLKPEFLQTIDKIKGAARCSSVGKGKFFSNEVNEMLLDVELTTRQLPCSQRSSIFGHLASFLPCTKDTLLKRAKKLRLERQDDQLKGPISKLKDAITVAMPEQIERHEAECQIWKQKQIENETNKEESKVEIKDGDTEDSEEEGEKRSQEPSKKKVAAPKKKFEWNETLRTLLCDVVRVKMKIYNYMKTRTQTAEEYLKAFLERDIKVLWPKGWMQTSVLFKESRPGHVAWTNPTKIKKVPVINKTSNSTANTPVNAIKQLTTPSSAPASAPLMVTKQGITPISGTQKSGAAPGSTPVRCVGSGDGGRLIPTLLDYAGDKQSSTKLALDTQVTVSKSNTDTKTGSIVGNTLSPGLSLLASSAASQKYMGERWDHVVSDILRSSYNTGASSPSNPQNSKQAEHKSDSSFMAQFQKYASSVFQQQLGKDDSKTSPPKNIQHPSHISPSLQIKPQDAQQIIQKMKAAQISKQGPPQAHQKHGANVQLASYLAQKSSGKSPPLMNQDAYKQFLENREKQLPQNYHGAGEGKTKPVTTQRINKPKTIVVYSTSGSSNSMHGKSPGTKFTSQSATNSNQDSAKKPILVRSISQGTVSSGNQRISPTSSYNSSQRVSPMSSLSAGQRQSPSKLNNNYNLSSLTSPTKGEVTATNLLQSLFGQIDQAHAEHKKSPSPSGVMSRSTLPQNKADASTIWSMSSIVQSQPGKQMQSTSPSSYPHPGMPKPVPGYQSIKLSNFSKESAENPAQSPTMKSSLYNQTSQGMPHQAGSNYVPNSPLLPGQQNSLQNLTGKSSNPSHGY